MSNEATVKVIIPSALKNTLFGKTIIIKIQFVLEKQCEDCGKVIDSPPYYEFGADDDLTYRCPSCTQKYFKSPQYRIDYPK